MLESPSTAVVTIRAVYARGLGTLRGSDVDMVFWLHHTFIFFARHGDRGIWS